MTGVKKQVFRPMDGRAAVYAELYPLYKRLHDAFGTGDSREPLGQVMKSLIAIRNRARSG
jgi:L-ribulokinase